MKRLYAAVRTWMRRRRSLDKKYRDYDEFMEQNFPHVIKSRDQHYH